MAELTPRERLQPCLLDRLTDDEPRKRAESVEARVISLRRYREAVLRDLTWLLNTRCYPLDGGLEDFPHAQHSVLNYGLPDLCGLTSSSVQGRQLEKIVMQALKTFEPRIDAGRLSVRVDKQQEEMGHKTIVLRVEGDLWAKPLPEALYLQTEIDLETGQCELVGRSNG